MTQTTRYARVLPKMGSERSKLLSENKIKALSESKNASDVAAQLRDTAYQEQISHLEAPLTGRKLERAYFENLIETYLKIIKYAPERANRYLNIYLQRLEAENVKTLVRTAQANLPTEQRLAKVYLSVEKYLDKTELIEDAAKAQGISQVAAVFKGTEYGPALAEGLKRYEETGSTTSMDIFIDTLFYEKLYAAYKSLPRRERPHAKFYASLENDSFILLTLLRGKNLGYDPNWLRMAVPRCYFNLTKEQVESIVSALNFEAAYKIVQGSHYAKYFEHKATPEETIGTAEKNFKKAVLTYAKKKYIREIFNVGSTLIFITLKEVEVHNLTALTLGVEAGMKSEVIRNQLLL
ncbi:MAG TPA: V-type ATPase subunit [Candidatus Acidoferrales bacterium]|nr:V-type ATPase subunit [Candidatus Acidoferrales bacterium]